MWVSQLQLAHFRNYARLDMDLGPGVLVFLGRNGQGKSNLLESLHVLATTRSPRASTERELVRWRDSVPGVEASADLYAPAFARIAGRVHRDDGERHLEVLIKSDRPAEGPAPRRGSPPSAIVSRSLTVNGLVTRASGYIGHLVVVYFAPEDVAVAAGSPSGRRRYLDIALSQISPDYLRALQRYNRVVLQRNQLLRRLREKVKSATSLDPWTTQLVELGALILVRRLRMLARIGTQARQTFYELAHTEAALEIVYHSSALADDSPQDASLEDLTRRLAARQRDLATREVEQGVTLVGPHRDDFAFLLDNVDLTTYGSRGQQRLAVLALKLAEADWMRIEIDEEPVVLLDDALSELDGEKQAYVLDRVLRSSACPRLGGRNQVWLTATGLDPGLGHRLGAAAEYYIDAGRLRRA